MLRDAWARWRIRIGPNGMEILRLFDDLEGQMVPEEGAFLFRAAAGRSTIVEIGSFRGKSCVLLARGAAANGLSPGDAPAHTGAPQVHAIDPRLNQAGLPTPLFSDADDAVFEGAIARHGVAERVNFIRATSRDALAKWDGRPIDLLWVDGDHTYEHVRFDLERWGGLVRVGGLIAAHDCRKGSDVARAWGEVVRPDAGWGSTRKVRSIAWATRMVCPRQ